MVKIVIDTPGGERGIGVAVSAGVRASRDEDIGIAFVGDSGIITRTLKTCGADPADYGVIHTDQAIQMAEHPLTALEKKRNASIRLAAEEVRSGRADALVSAGHTGASVVASRECFGLFDQVRKPALGQLLPCHGDHRFLLLDIGASSHVTAADLLTFGFLGHAYAKTILNQSRPRIGLLNIGTETSKGNNLLRDTHKTLKRSPLNFIGNVEGDAMWQHAADVVITDAVTGNIVLKTIEGLARFILKTILSSGHLDRRALADRRLSGFNPSTYSGAPLLGVNGLCIVCHGNASEDELVFALKRAKWCVDNDLVTNVRCEIKQLMSGQNDTSECRSYEE